MRDVVVDFSAVRRYFLKLLYESNAFLHKVTPSVTSYFLSKLVTHVISVFVD